MTEESYCIEQILPFSPLILKAIMPTTLVELINERADQIYLDDAELRRRDWSKNLAGNIRSEIRITDLAANEFELMHFIISVAKEFAVYSKNLMIGQRGAVYGREVEFRIALEDVWINEMVAGDFSPVHFHSGCQISCVGFLKNPPSYEIEFGNDKENKNSVGCLQFIDSRTVMGASNVFMVRPTVGYFYMFPAWMLHCVYPFRSEGVRRSFSANLSIIEADPDSHIQ